MLHAQASCASVNKGDFEQLVFGRTTWWSFCSHGIQARAFNGCSTEVAQKARIC